MAATTMHTEDVALFNDPPYNTAEDKITWVEFRPTFISQGGYSSIHFHIAGNSAQYIDLGRSELHIRLKIEKEGGEPWTDDDESGLPIDQIFHTMWSSVDIALNQVQVSTSGTNYMYKAAIENLLNYSKATKENQLTSIGMTPDTSNFNSSKPGESTPGLGVNIGLIARKNLFSPKGRGSCEFTGPLLADVCNQSRLILDNVDVDINLWPSKDEFRLMVSPDTIKCRLKIEDIYLSVCKVQVNEYCMTGHKAGLEISKGKYPIQKTVMLTKILPQGSFGDTFEDIFQGLVPSKLVVGMVDAEAYSGHFQKNPLQFQPFDIESLGFYVNGEPTPKAPFRYNISNNQFLDALQSLYKITGKCWEDTDIGITRTMWKEGLAMTAFDVDPTTATDFRYLGIPKEGHTRLSLKLKSATTTPVAVIIYATFPARIEIDDQRNVSTKGPKELIRDLLQKTGSTAKIIG